MFFFDYANSENGKLSPRMVFVQVAYVSALLLKEVRVCFFLYECVCVCVHK